MAPSHDKRMRGRPKKKWQKCVLQDAAASTRLQNLVLDKVKEMAER